MYSGVVNFSWAGEPRKCSHTLGLTVRVPFKGADDKLAMMSRAYQIGSCEIFLNSEPRINAMRCGFSRARQHKNARLPVQNFSSLFGETRSRYNDPDPNAARTIRVEFGLYDVKSVESSFNNFLNKRVEFENYCTQRCGGEVRICEEPVLLPKIGHDILYADSGRVEALSYYTQHLKITRIRLLEGLGAYELAELIVERITHLLRRLNHTPDCAENPKFQIQASIVDVHCNNDLQRLMRYDDTRILDYHEDLCRRQDIGGGDMQHASLQLTQPWEIQIGFVCASKDRLTRGYEIVKQNIEQIFRESSMDLDLLLDPNLPPKPLDIPKSGGRPHGPPTFRTKLTMEIVGPPLVGPVPKLKPCPEEVLEDLLPSKKSQWKKRWTGDPDGPDAEPAFSPHQSFTSGLSKTTDTNLFVPYTPKLIGGAQLEYTDISEALKRHRPHHR